MKFNCPQCNKPYLIADERVRGKILKIRCKNCSTVITVREGMEQGGPGGRRAKPPGAGGRGRAPSEAEPMELSGRDLRRPETPQRLSSVMLEVDEDALPPPDDEWYVSVDGVQDGPFSLERAREWVASRGSEDEIYCWRDTFADWLPVEDVPELQNARRVSKLALRAPPVGPTPSPNAMRPVPERAASAPDPDLFGGEDESMTTIDPRPFAGMGERGPAPGRAAAAEADDEPLMRLIVADDDRAPAAAAPRPPAAARPASPARAPAPAQDPLLPSERPVVGRPLSMPAIASANASVDQSSAAPRAWLSDALSGPQPALRLPSPYPTLSEAQQAGFAGAPAPARSGKRMFLIVVLLLAVIGSGAGAYVVVRKFVRVGGGDSMQPGDAADSTLPSLRPQDLSAALQRPEVQAALKQCYERARKDDPKQTIGRIDLDLTVNPAGEVSSVVLSQHADTKFGACLTKSIQTWTFSPSAEGVSARVPLIFGP
jgi:predicted Zn finger-like uncharacterized protein